MKTIRFLIDGGLGNQMFQVAHAVSFARKAGARPRFLDTTGYDRTRAPRKWELDCFGITGEPLSRFQNKMLYYRIGLARRLYPLYTKNPEDPDFISTMSAKPVNLGRFQRKILKYGGAFIARGLHRINPRILTLGGLFEIRFQERCYGGDLHAGICQGYWQGERFFVDSADSVKKMFTFPELAETPAGFVLDRNKPNVAVHIRRDDYVSVRQARHHVLVCNANWYRKALQKMRENVPGAVFHLFSDDRSWAQKQFGREPDVSLVKTGPEGPAWVDMALMARCQHFIMSNSTYSWWAVYLGRNEDSVIIAPRLWLRDPFIPTREHPVYCEGWQLL